MSTKSTSDIKKSPLFIDEILLRLLAIGYQILIWVIVSFTQGLTIINFQLFPLLCGRIPLQPLSDTSPINHIGYCSGAFIESINSIRSLVKI